MDLIERLIDEADGYGDGPVVVHDIEGLRALLREAAAEIERLRADGKLWEACYGHEMARAERLAEALRELVALGHPRDPAIIAAKNALRDHDQEVVIHDP